MGRYISKIRGHLFVVLMTGFLILSSCTDDGSKRPNIIFIMADDHAFQAISAYNEGLVETPNLDRLAEEGMLFTRAYVSNSISSPSRAVCLTGKHSHINGLRDNVTVFDSTQQTFPKLLQEAGYQTSVFGKWHLKSQPTGFDHWKVLPGQGHYYQPDFLTPDGKVKEKGYVTDIITGDAIDWLEQKRDKDKPFMMMYQHKAPHREWMPPQEYLSEFMERHIPEPATLFDDYKNRGSAAKEAEMLISKHMGLSNDNKIYPRVLNELGIEEFMGWYKPVFKRNYGRMTAPEKEKWDAVYGPVNQAFKNGPPRGDSLTQWKYQRYMEDYLSCIKSIDDNLGRLLNYLDKSGLAENTMVVYTSDQGFYLGEHGWFDKRFMYEESYRTPLIIRWPASVKAGSVNENLVQNLDFAETILDAAGLTIPNDMQGLSLMPLLRGEDTAWRDALYYHYYEYPSIHMVKRHYGISTERYKLIHFYYDIDEWELYDLQQDPNEMNNVFNQPEYEGVQNNLMKKLDSLQVVYQDSDSLRKVFIKEDLDRKH